MRTADCAMRATVPKATIKTSASSVAIGVVTLLRLGDALQFLLQMQVGLFERLRRQVE